MARTRAGRPPRNDPRMNIAFYDDHMQFCRDMAWKNHQSVTQYVNSLIAQEMEKHNKTEQQAAGAEGKEVL